MTTAQDLVDAVRPCLPLPHMDRVQLHSDMTEDFPYGWVMHHRCDGRLLRPSEVIGAIWQACAERGWSIHLDPQDEGGSVTIFYGHSGAVPTTEYATVHGTDAIALCRAYAAACEAGKGAT